VIIQALGHPEPFKWASKSGSLAPSQSQQLFEETARFGIRYGFVISIHNDGGAVAVATFAADERRPQFKRTISEHARVLQLMAMYFHARRRQYPGVATGRNLRSTRPTISAFPDMAVGSAYTSSFSGLAQRSLVLRPAHSRCHRIS
jgi:hypothetical protein